MKRTNHIDNMCIIHINSARVWLFCYHLTCGLSPLSFRPTPSDSCLYQNRLQSSSHHERCHSRSAHRHVFPSTEIHKPFTSLIFVSLAHEDKYIKQIQPEGLPKKWLSCIMKLLQLLIFNYKYTAINQKFNYQYFAWFHVPHMHFLVPASSD